MSLRHRLVAYVGLAVLCAGLTVAALGSGSPPAVEAGTALPAPSPASVPLAPSVPPSMPRAATKPRVAVKAKPKPTVKRPPSRPASRPRPATRRPVPVKATPKPVVRTETVQQRGQRVLASLHYDWQRLGYTIVFLPERKGYLGYTDGATKTVTIWIRSSESDLVLAHTIAHELGHVLDFTHNNAAKHAAYLSLRGINPTTNWYGCDGCTDYSSPAGDWAEVFAYWLAGPGDFRSQMGPPPDKAHMALIAQLYTY